MAWIQTWGSEGRRELPVRWPRLGTVRRVAWKLGRRALERARGRAAGVPQRVQGLVRWAMRRDAALGRDPALMGLRQPAPIPVRMRPAPPAAAAVGRWVAKVTTADESCIPGGAHDGCRAAAELGGVPDPDRSVLDTLENTVTAPGRPTCVRQAAVDALGRLGMDEARACLERMRTVTRRRLEWDGSGRERTLLAQIDAHLEALHPQP